MVAVQLAARQPQRITRMIAVAGSIESSSWTPSDPAERRAQAQSVVDTQRPKLADPEEWRKFNGAGPLPRTETLARDDALAALRVVGGFMATPREAVIQYWRENLLIDLDADLRKLRIPVLDLQPLAGPDQETKRAAHLENLRAASAPDGVRARFLFDTRHFVMFDRPEVLDRLIAHEIAGEPISDWHP
jgi:pimeloyl-ACP methyl ester carboxylesterase